MNKRVAIAIAKTIFNLLVLTGILLAVWWGPAVPAIGEAVGIGDADTAWRAFGILIGIYFIVSGNRFPKGQLMPASSENSWVLQQFQRFLGWTFVLWGLVLVLALLVLPVSAAFAVLGIAAPLVVFAGSLRMARRMCQRKREQRAI